MFGRSADHGIPSYNPPSYVYGANRAISGIAHIGQSAIRAKGRIVRQRARRNTGDNLVGFEVDNADAVLRRMCHEREASVGTNSDVMHDARNIDTAHD